MDLSPVMLKQKSQKSVCNVLFTYEDLLILEKQSLINLKF